MKVTSLILWKMDQELKNLWMVISTRVNTKMENLMDMVNIIGMMVVIIKGILKLALEVAMVYGKGIMDKVINMKDNFSKIKNKVMVFIHGKVAIYIKGIIIKICVMAMVNFFGKMEVFIEVFGKMMYNQDKENFLQAKKS